MFANEDEATAFCGPCHDFCFNGTKLTAPVFDCRRQNRAAGAYIADGQSVQAIAAEKVDTVVDTTAAGDLWAAGFLYGWLQKWPIIDCAQLGARMGAAVVQIQGSQLAEKTWEH